MRPRMCVAGIDDDSICIQLGQQPTYRVGFPPPPPPAAAPPPLPAAASPALRPWGAWWPRLVSVHMHVIGKLRALDRPLLILSTTGGNTDHAEHSHTPDDDDDDGICAATASSVHCRTRPMAAATSTRPGPGPTSRSRRARSRARRLKGWWSGKEV